MQISSNTYITNKIIGDTGNQQNFHLKNRANQQIW